MIGTYKRRILFAIIFVFIAIISWFYLMWLEKKLVLADPSKATPTPEVTTTIITPTITVGNTPMPTATVEPTIEPTNTVENTSVPKTPVPDVTETPSKTEGNTPMPSLTIKPTPSPTPTVSVKPTATATVKPTATPKPTPTQTPTPKPTNTPKPTPTPTPTLPPDILPDIGEEIKNDKGKVIAVGIDPNNVLDMEVPKEINHEWNGPDLSFEPEYYDGVKLTRINFGIHDYVFRAKWDGSRFTMWFFGVDFVFPLHMKPDEVTMHWSYYGSDIDWEKSHTEWGYWFEDFTISVNGKVVYYEEMLKTPYEGGFAIG